MELILVRHGQPAWDDGQGRNCNDPGLTERGHAQAAAVAKRLADHDDEPAAGPVDRLIVSPALRAAQTAAPVSEALAMDAEVEPWLLEIHNPDAWEGEPIVEIEAAFAEIRGRTRDQMWAGLPGGEPIRAFHERIVSGLHQFLQELDITSASTGGLWNVGPAAPRRVIAVAHAGTNSTVISHLLGVAPEPWEWDRFALGHASVAVLRTVPMAGAHLWSLRSLGDANHIPVPDRTH